MTDGPDYAALAGACRRELDGMIHADDGGGGEWAELMQERDACIARHLRLAAGQALAARAAPLSPAGLSEIRRRDRECGALPPPPAMAAHRDRRDLLAALE